MVARVVWRSGTLPVLSQSSLGRPPPLTEGGAGPIYDRDTRYFWLPEPDRYQAQTWEYDTLNGHRTTNPLFDWIGHCNGVSCAQALEPDPPTDCGALSQDDLEGLLSEIYMDCKYWDLTQNNTAPSDMWLALRACLGPTAPTQGVMVIDFDTAVVPNTDIGIVWDWPVYGYLIDYQVTGGILAQGVMTMYYEDHCYDAQHAHGVATYGFWCFVQGSILYPTPVHSTGGWYVCQGPHDLISPPDQAAQPYARDPEGSDHNPYINYDTLKRVIDHKTIVCDDPWARYWPHPPPGDYWEQRQLGYGGSCWAAPGTDWPPPSYGADWQPLWLRHGLWEIYVYKTPPTPGDIVSQHTPVETDDPYHRATFFDQSEPPFDQWQLMVGPFEWFYPDIYHIVGMDANYHVYPSWSKVYMDALRLEWVDEAGDGGANSSALALGDKLQRVEVTPNPAARTARVCYMVHEHGRVDVAIYDVTGRVVLGAAQGMKLPGVQTATISVAGLPAGTYMARVTASGINTTCRFVVCR